MDRAEWSLAAHAGMALMNPLDPARIDEVVALLELAPHAQLLDAGCGKGEVLVRIAERWGCGGIGIERHPRLVEEARAQAAARVPDAGLEFAAGDFDPCDVDPGSLDLAISIGALAGGYDAVLGTLAELARPGGKVLLGEGYWRREPREEYLAALGATRDELGSCDDVVAAGERAGLTPRHSVVSSTDDWDRYEERWSLNGERYATAHAGEPGVDEFLAWIRAGRDRYLRLGGRETLGFGLFLFRKGG